MAGYNGYSKSNNAIEAESNGLYPISIAVKMVAKQAGCTQKEARNALETNKPAEWHHTSKHYNCTDYYSVSRAVDLILHDDADWTENQEEETHEKEIIPVNQETCNHIFVAKNFKGKGGVEYIHHFKCAICGLKKEA